jgi:hypothetical protein
MQAARPSEASVTIYQSTRRNITEDLNLHPPFQLREHINRMRDANKAVLYSLIPQIYTNCSFTND